MALVAIFMAVILILVFYPWNGEHDNTPPIRNMGVSISKSPDGSNWTLNFRRVPSGLMAVQTTLAVFRADGSVNLTPTAFSDLSLAAHGSLYVSDGNGEVDLGEMIIMETTWYAAGSKCQIAEASQILWSGTLP